MTNDVKSDTDAETDAPEAAFRAKAERYGAGYAAFSEALTGRGVDRAVFGAKVVIGVITVYALGSAVLAGFSA